MLPLSDILSDFSFKKLTLVSVALREKSLRKKKCIYDIANIKMNPAVLLDLKNKRKQ